MKGGVYGANTIYKKIMSDQTLYMVYMLFKHKIWDMVDSKEWKKLYRQFKHTFIINKPVVRLNCNYTYTFLTRCQGFILKSILFMMLHCSNRLFKFI